MREERRNEKIVERLEKELKQCRADLELYMILMERNPYNDCYEKLYLKTKAIYDTLRLIKGVD